MGRTFLITLLLALAPTVAHATPEPALHPAEAAVQKLSDAELKEFYLHCTRAAVRGQLGTGEIALCSTGYELLLRRAFHGNFQTLLEWRRSLQPAKGAALASPF